MEDVRVALYASKIVAYAQGLDEIFAGAAEYGWDINVGAVARIWRGGCIIRAKFLNRITEAYDVTAGSQIAGVAAVGAVFHRGDHRRRRTRGGGWSRARRSRASRRPGFAAALSYYDGLRSERLPAALIQGQRDFFGAHTYQRVDKRRHLPHPVVRRPHRGADRLTPRGETASTRGPTGTFMRDRWPGSSSLFGGDRVFGRLAAKPMSAPTRRRPSALAASVRGERSALRHSRARSAHARSRATAAGTAPTAHPPGTLQGRAWRTRTSRTAPG